VTISTTIAVTENTLTSLARRLVSDGHLSTESAQELQQHAKQLTQPLFTYLLSNKVLSASALAHAAASEFGLPLLDLEQFELDSSMIEILDETLILEHRLLPLGKKANTLFVAIADPTQFNSLNEIRFKTRLNIETVLVEADKLNAMIEQALTSADTALMELSDSSLDDLDFTHAEDPLEKEDEFDVNDTPVVRFINKVLLDAIRRGASDVHFEPYDKRYRVRFRLDGILQEMASPPVSLGSRMASRIKVMAQLDISEKRLPQDGRIKVNLSKNHAVDFRVSTCPTLFGEKVVLRILDSMNTELNVESLGFDEAQRILFEQHIAKPHGMVLVTGPTGSGKTITLYSAISILNTVDKNISTAEDPAEIYIAGINQVNINSKTGLSFAHALRSFLRQDPDIIMVGEMRDLETAEIAIKAAQTGHLVLSTLHTNDAPQTLTRMANMGVAPFNIAASVSLIIAQRLVRKLCEHCKKTEKLPHDAMLEEGFREDELADLNIYTPVGCDKCNDGYRGRIGIFQVMPVSEQMGWLIMEGGNSLQLAKQAQEEGIMDLREAGLAKVRAGITSLEELNRVTRD